MHTNAPSSLTANAIQNMYQMDSSMDEEFFFPVVQVLRLRKMHDDKGEPKWVVALSDSCHFLFGECSADLTKLIHDHVIAQNAIIRIHSFAMMTRGDRRVCYIQDAHQAAPNPGTFLGSPTDIRLYAHLDKPKRNRGTMHDINDNVDMAESRVPEKLGEQRVYEGQTMDAFFSSRSKPTWQNEVRDLPHRKVMIESIEKVLTESEKIQEAQTEVSTKRKAELGEIAIKWEIRLYGQAPSFEAYIDRSTFPSRVQRLSRTWNCNGEITLQQHQRLHLLRHSMSCNEANCSVSPFCRDIKHVVDHMEQCYEADCKVPFCYTMSLLTHHSRSCREATCKICSPHVHMPGCVICQDEEGRKSGRGSTQSQTALQQEYLLTMQHASKCPHEENGQCLLTPLCFDLKKVWIHKVYCTNKACMFPFCALANVYSEHFHSCRNNSCQVCPPVRATLKQHGINRLAVDPQLVAPATPQPTTSNQPSTASQNTHAAAASASPTSDPDIVASQVAIYQRIQESQKRKRVASSPPQKQHDSSQESDNSVMSVSTLSINDDHSTVSKETSRKPAAVPARSSQSSSSSTATNSPIVDHEKKIAPSSPSGDKKPSEVVHSYLGTTYRTQHNTLSVICAECNMGLFIPPTATSISCQECHGISSDFELNPDSPYEYGTRV